MNYRIDLEENISCCLPQVPKWLLIALGVRYRVSRLRCILLKNNTV